MSSVAVLVYTVCMFKNINAIQGSVLAFVFFVLINFLVSGAGYNDEINLVLTVSSFLFAILSGFFITRLNTRYDKIVESIGEEDASWLALYQTARIIGPDFAKRIGNLIDQYYILAYDYFLGNYYKATSPIYFKVYEEFRDCKMKENVKIEAATQAFVGKLEDIELCRNMSSIYTEQKVTSGQWLVLITLGLIMVVCLFVIRSSSFFSQLTTILLSTTIVLVLLITRDLQLIRVGGQDVLLESGLEMFDFIGKKRYFHQMYIKNGRYKIPAGADYRLGIHKIGEKPRIILVKGR